MARENVLRKKTRTMASEKAGIQFPVGRFRRKLKNGKYAERIATGAAIFMAAAIEYLVAEVLELAGELISVQRNKVIVGNAAKEYKKVRINPRHLMLAIRNDAEFDVLLQSVMISEGGVKPHINKELLLFPGTSKSRRAQPIEQPEVEEESNREEESDQVDKLQPPQPQQRQMEDLYNRNATTFLIDELEATF
ncbi:Histone H2A [Aphelenchoides besseyi]|nr:Histone H2A [Aphelenchoides besseyi]KAI6204966.1 Histone H2A [Aphelenchoides besseyi]